MSEQLLHAWHFALNGLSRCGVNTAALLEKLGVNTESIRNQATPYPTNLWCELLDEAVRQTGEPDLGLKANLGADFADYGPQGFATLNAENLGEALKVMISYIGLSQSGVEVTSHVAKGVCVLEVCITDWRVPVHRTNIDWLISFGIAFIRTWCGRNWSPKEAHFMYAEPKDTAIYQHAIGCPIFFSSQSNCFVFSESVLDKTKTDADPRLFEILRDDLDRLLKQTLAATDAEHDLITEVQTEIARRICSGAPSIDQVATRLNISTRTLQRRLADKGYAFKELVEVIRHKMAVNYIKNSQYSFIDITFLLGYSEVGAFSRAFRRWTGKTPAQYRKQEGESITPADKR